MTLLLPGAAGLYHHGGDQRDGAHAADRRPDHWPGNGKSIVILYTGPAGGYVLFVACGGAVSLSDSLYGREPDEKNRYGISRAPFHCAERPGR